MRMATVVLPVPGLPVKLMCRLGPEPAGPAASPRFRRSLSTTNRAAMSRMRCLTGARPTRSRSSSSITDSTWLCASTSLTVRAWGAALASAAVAAGVAGACVLPGMLYSGAAMVLPPVQRAGAASCLRMASITAL